MSEANADGHYGEQTVTARLKVLRWHELGEALADAGAEIDSLQRQLAHWHEFVRQPFAGLVSRIRAEERERCAKVAEDFSKSRNDCWLPGCFETHYTSADCAAALIRALKDEVPTLESPAAAALKAGHRAGSPEFREAVGRHIAAEEKLSEGTGRLDSNEWEPKK